MKTGTSLLPLTSDNSEITRIAVDSQQTSFEDNREFRYTDVWDNIAPTDQIVYRVLVNNPLVLYSRKMVLVTGGRFYKAYGELQGSPIHTFTGTLQDSGTLSPKSTILRKGLTDVPDSGIVIQRAVGPGIFTPAVGVSPSTVDMVIAGGNANNSSSEYSPDGSKVGVAGGIQFYLVLDDLAGNVDTFGFIELDYEKR